MTEQRKTSSLSGKSASQLSNSFGEAHGRTMSQAELVTFVKTMTSRFDDDEREYLAVMFQKEIFGAFLTACQARKEESGFSRVELAERMGKDKSVVTRFLQSYSNMKATTIAEFANAVEADIVFFLIDRRDRSRIFTGHGVEHCQSAWSPRSEAVRAGGARPTAPVALNSFGAKQLATVGTATPWAHMFLQSKDIAREDAAR